MSSIERTLWKVFIGSFFLFVVHVYLDRPAFQSGALATVAGVSLVAAGVLCLVRVSS